MDKERGLNVETAAPPKPELKHGTEDEHLGTLRRAMEGGVTAIWSGDMRNPYLLENLAYGEREGIIKLTPYTDYDGQESGFRVKWLKRKF